MYDVLLIGLSKGKRCYQITRWVRGIQANSLTEASNKALHLHPITGCTPSQVSMTWEVYPQPRGNT